MSTAKCIHFVGLDNVIQAYRNQEIAAYAIFSYNQFLFKYEGDDLNEGEAMLRGWADLLAGENWGHHTMRVYDDPKPKITAKKDYDGSFNFQLQENPNKVGGIRDNAAISQIAALKKRIEELEAEDDEPSFLDKVGAAMEHPALAPFIPMLTEKVATLFFGPDPDAQVAGPTPTLGNDLQAINAAVHKLMQHRNDTADLLTKIALMAERKPQMFTMYVNMFNNVKI